MGWVCCLAFVILVWCLDVGFGCVCGWWFACNWFGFFVRRDMRSRFYVGSFLCGWVLNLGLIVCDIVGGFEVGCVAFGFGLVIVWGSGFVVWVGFGVDAFLVRGFWV